MALNSGLGGRGRGRGGGGYQGPGKVQCDTFLEVRGRGIFPFSNCQQCRLLRGAKVAGKATKQNSFNSLLCPARDRISSLCVSFLKSLCSDLLWIFPCSFPMNINIFSTCHMLPTHFHRPHCHCPAGLLAKRVCLPLNREGRGRRGQCCSRDNVTFLFVKILCQLLGK